MKNEELEKMTDEQLRLAFAREVAKWTTLPNQGHAGGFLARSPEGRIDWSSIGGTEDAALRWNCPEYATSADAVLPYLEKYAAAKVVYQHSIWYVSLFIAIDGGEPGEALESPAATGNTPARAACIALILAARATRAAAEAKEGT